MHLAKIEFPKEHPVLGNTTYDSKNQNMIILGWTITGLTIIFLLFWLIYHRDLLEDARDNFTIVFPSFISCITFAVGITLIHSEYRSWRFKIYEQGIVSLTFNPRGNTLEGSYNAEFDKFIRYREIPFNRIKEIYIHCNGTRSGLRLYLGEVEKNQKIVADLVTYSIMGSSRYKRTQVLIESLKKVMGDEWNLKFKKTDRLWKGKKFEKINGSPMWLWMTNPEDSP